MEENWNFHGFIAVPLECYGRKNNEEPFFTADEIESGKFVDAMIHALSIPYDILPLLRFLSKCSCFTGKHANEIDNEDAKELFEEFMMLYNNKTMGE